MSESIIIIEVFLYRYFQKKDEQVDENIEVEEERPIVYNWWHKKLADFFENVENVDRFVEVISLIM